jgi:hypothetical protein
VVPGIERPAVDLADIAAIMASAVRKYFGSRKGKQANAEGRLDLYSTRAHVAAHGLWPDAAGTCDKPGIEPLPQR